MSLLYIILHFVAIEAAVKCFSLVAVMGHATHNTHNSWPHANSSAATSVFQLKNQNSDFVSFRLPTATSSFHSLYVCVLAYVNVCV